MSAANGVPILVTDHAMWKAAERFPRFDTLRIEGEVREALRSGRVSTSREGLGLYGKSYDHNLYVWTLDGRRVYALTHDEDPPQFVVLTTMRASNRR